MRRRGARLSTGSPAAAAAACAATLGALKPVKPQQPAGHRANSTAGRAAVARPPAVPSAHRDSADTIRVGVRGHSTECRIASTPGSPDQPSPGDHGGHGNAMATHAYPQFPQPYPHRAAASTQAPSASRALTVDNTTLSSHTDRQPDVESSEWLAARRLGGEPRPTPAGERPVAQESAHAGPVRAGVLAGNFPSGTQQVMIAITAVTHLTEMG